MSACCEHDIPEMARLAHVRSVGISLHAIYLMQGADDTASTDRLGGNIGVAELCAAWAPWVYDFLDQIIENKPDIEWPGVFEYEVTVAMGAWLGLHDNCIGDEFNAELSRRFTTFMEQ